MRDIDVALPLSCRIAVTGVSGSGKSSLAFDTIAREGLRRFLEATTWGQGGGPAARRLAAIPRPRVRAIEGLPAVIAVGQGDPALGPRTTLGTLTGVTPSLRLLLAHFGDAFCPSCDAPRERRGTAAIVASWLEKVGETGVGARILAPLRAAGGFESQLSKLPMSGITRALLATGAADTNKTALDEIRVDEPFELPRGVAAAYAVVDRLVPRREHFARLCEDVEKAIALGSGGVVFEADGALSHFATSRSCARCGADLPEVAPRLLGASSPPGQCQDCKGLSETCDACGGSGLSRAGRSVRLAGKDLADLESWEVSELLAWTLKVGIPDGPAARELRAEISARLGALGDLGLGAMHLQRRAAGLSTGECQRARCAAAIGASVRGALFVFDEPTVGCHPADRDRLLSRLDALRDAGNTVLLVEHDLEAIRTSDFVVELGPGAGSAGGKVVIAGNPREIAACAESPTGALLAARGARAAAPRMAAIPNDAKWLVVRGARGHNLKSIDVRFPIGAVSVVCGVSGSGKSSLVFGTLGAAARRALAGESTGAEALLPHRRVDGLEGFERRLAVGPKLPAPNARSTPASILGVASQLRELFAATEEARARGFDASHFSANRSGWRKRDGDAAADAGRCEACAGLGFRTLDLELLESTTVECEVCGGTRFSAATLAVRWKGRDIAEWMALPIEEAARDLEAIPKIARALAPAISLGLGYVRLGERADVLSGGELKRLQLARELARGDSPGGALVLLDEPTRGLHGRDVGRLLEALDSLAARGHTVVVVEHSLEVLRRADWVIELGPGPGAAGGSLVFEGTPADLARAATATAEALRSEGRARRSEPQRSHSLRGADVISIRGAHAKNLREVDVDLPRGAFSTIAGPSGAGKTALAFDVLAAEGRRRFLSALAVAERRSLERMDRAEAAAVDGLGATVALSDPPAAVPWGEATGLLGLLRTLFASFATSHCPKCGIALLRREPAELVALALSQFSGRRARITAPIEPAVGARWTERAAELRARGYARILVNGVEARLEEAAPRAGDRLELVIDRLEIAEAGRARLLEALGEASIAGGGRGAFVFVGDGPGGHLAERLDFDRLGGCTRCGFRLEGPLTPADFARRPLSPVAAAARLDGAAWPAAGWTLGAVVDSLGSVFHETAAEAQPILDAIRARAAASARLLEPETQLSLERPLAAGRAAWILCAAEASPGGSTVVVDDPTRGLSQQKAAALLAALREACAGKTLVAASADPLAARAADRVIALGPGGGPQGGSLVSAGAPPRAAQRPSARGESEAKGVRRLPKDPAALDPAAIDGLLDRRRERVFVGFDEAAPRTPVEILGLLEPIGALLARTPEARTLGFDARRFSFVDGKKGSGRCEVCRGRGVTEIDLDFLPGEVAPCLSCGGARFAPPVLGCRLYGKNMWEILNLGIDEAAAFFADHPRCAAPLEAARKLGLGHLRLGAPPTRASRGEQARLELAGALAAEPSRTALAVAHAADGLFGADRERLLAALEGFVASGGEALLVDPRGGAEAEGA